MRTYSTAQGALLRALQWPKWEESPQKGGSMCAHGWVTLLYSRDQHSVVKQLDPNNFFLKKQQNPPKLKAHKTLYLICG